jgi:ABC-type uncharacterized transport system ATPase subunit
MKKYSSIIGMVHQKFHPGDQTSKYKNLALGNMTNEQIQFKSILFNCVSHGLLLNVHFTTLTTAYNCSSFC